MRRQALILVIPLGTALLAASVMGMRPATRSHRFADSRGGLISQYVLGGPPVEALNDAIQDRFRNRPGVGMSRLSVVPEHLYRFDPETPAEKSAVEMPA